MFGIVDLYLIGSRGCEQVRRAIALLLLAAERRSRRRPTCRADPARTASSGRGSTRCRFRPRCPRSSSSGLTNRLYVRVSLLDASGSRADQRTVEIAIRYDLWDQKFHRDQYDGWRCRRIPAARQRRARSNALLAALRTAAPVRRAPRCRPRATCTLRAELLLNPIGSREDAHDPQVGGARTARRMSAPTRASRRRMPSSTASSSSTRDGSDVAAGLARRRWQSAPFRLGRTDCMKDVRVGLLLTVTILVMAVDAAGRRVLPARGRAAHQPQPRLQSADRARARQRLGPTCATLGRLDEPKSARSTARSSTRSRSSSRSIPSPSSSSSGMLDSLKLYFGVGLGVAVLLSVGARDRC